MRLIAVATRKLHPKVLLRLGCRHCMVRICVHTVLAVHRSFARLMNCPMCRKVLAMLMILSTVAVVELSCIVLDSANNTNYLKRMMMLRWM